VLVENVLGAEVMVFDFLSVDKIRTVQIHASAHPEPLRFCSQSAKTADAVTPHFVRWIWSLFLTPGSSYLSRQRGSLVLVENVLGAEG
jgi:hypothetical protein